MEEDRDLWWRGREEEEEERTAAAEAVEAREPGVFRLGGGTGGVPRPMYARTHTRTHTRDQVTQSNIHTSMTHTHIHTHQAGFVCGWAGR